MKIPNMHRPALLGCACPRLVLAHPLLECIKLCIGGSCAPGASRGCTAFPVTQKKQRLPPFTTQTPDWGIFETCPNKGPPCSSAIWFTRICCFWRSFPQNDAARAIARRFTLPSLAKQLDSRSCRTAVACLRSTLRPHRLHESRPLPDCTHSSGCRCNTPGALGAGGGCLPTLRRRCLVSFGRGPDGWL